MHTSAGVSQRSIRSRKTCQYLLLKVQQQQIVVQEFGHQIISVGHVAVMAKHPAMHEHVVQHSKKSGQIRKLVFVLFAQHV
jgi:hypothetical protein